MAHGSVDAPRVRRRQAEHRDHHAGRRPARPAAGSRSHDARSVQGVPASSGRSTCQARVVALLGAGLHQAGGRVEDRGDVAVGRRRAARRTRCRSAARGRRRLRVGRDTSARTSAVNSASVGGGVEDLVLAEGDAVAAPDRVGQPSSTLPRITRMPCSGPVERVWTMYAGMSVSTPSARSPGPSRRTRRGRPPARRPRRRPARPRPAAAARHRPRACPARGRRAPRPPRACPGAPPRGSPGRLRLAAARSNESAPSTAARTAATSGDDPADQHRDPGRARQQREQRQHGSSEPEPPRRAEVAASRPLSRSSSRRAASGSRPVSSSRPRRRRRGSPGATTARGARARAERGGGRAPDRAVADRAGHDQRSGRDRRRRPSDGGEAPTAPARTPRPGPAAGPTRHAARQRRSGVGVGEAERGVREPRQHGRRRPRGRAVRRPTRRRRPAPGRSRGPTSSSHRGAPAESTSRPTTRRNRQAPHSASGTASSRTPRPRPTGCRRAAVASSASGSTYAGAGTAVPGRAGATSRSAGATSRRRRPGPATGRRRLTAPYAARAPTSASTTKAPARGPPGWSGSGRPGRCPRQAVVLVDGRGPPRRGSLAPRPPRRPRAGVRRRPAPGWWRPRPGRRRSRGRGGRAATTAPAAAAYACSSAGGGRVARRGGRRGPGPGCA